MAITLKFSLTENTYMLTYMYYLFEGGVPNGTDHNLS